MLNEDGVDDDGEYARFYADFQTLAERVDKCGFYSILYEIYRFLVIKNWI